MCAIMYNSHCPMQNWKQVEFGNNALLVHYLKKNEKQQQPKNKQTKQTKKQNKQKTKQTKTKNKPPPHTKKQTKNKHCNAVLQYLIKSLICLQ